MIDWFKQLTPVSKMFIAGGVVVIAILLFPLLSRGDAIEPAAEATTPSNGNGSSLSPGDGATQPSEDPLVNPSDIPTPKLPQTTELPVEEQQAAMAVATPGFLEYYNMSADEAPEVRQQRLAPYFVVDALALRESPLGEMVSSDEELKVYSDAVLNFSEPIGGSSEAFNVLIGATVRGQISPPEDSGEVPYIQKSTMVIFEITLTKQSDGWKITEINEQ